MLGFELRRTRRSPAARRARRAAVDRGRARDRRRAVAMKIAFLHALPFDERMWEPQLSEFDAIAPKLYPLGESFDEWALGRAPAAAGDVRRGRRVDGRLHRGGDRAARAGAARRARARRLPRRRRPARARAAARGVDPHRARAGRRGPLGGGGQELLRARDAARRSSSRRTGSPPSRIPRGSSARSRRSATAPTRPRP